MIILRKDQLKLIDPKNELMSRSPKKYDFTTELESAKSVSNVLFDKMDELGGVGLSANQVGIDLQVFVMGKGDQKIAVFNPEIVEYIGETIVFKEGCLSYPGLFLNVKRPAAIKVRYTNEKGELIETTFAGITARIFQHEYDHMQGKDYTSYASKFKMDLAKRKYANKRKKLIRKHAETTMLNALKGK